MKSIRPLLMSTVGFSLFAIQSVANAGFTAIPVQSGPNTTLSNCNPTQNPSELACKVNGLPGSASLPGYIVKSSATRNIVSSGRIVGTLYDRVWCLGSGTTCNATKTYILGMRARQLVAPPPDYFYINDIFRKIRPGSTVDVAYFMGAVSGGTDPNTAGAGRYLYYSGRTLHGLNEPVFSGQTKTTNNTWIDFRVVSNSTDRYYNRTEWTPWVLARQACVSDYNPTPQPLSARLWDIGETYPLPILTNAYVCNP